VLAVRLAGGSLGQALAVIAPTTRTFTATPSTAGGSGVDRPRADTLT
jgi:hypothetical protein